MFDFYVDPLFNDLRVQDGAIVYVRGEDKIAQQIRIALNVELGEWFLGVGRGVPYYSETGTLNDGTTGILGGKYSAAEISALLRKVILEVPRVLRITELNIGQLDEQRALRVNGLVIVDTTDISGVGTQAVARIDITL